MDRRERNEDVMVAVRAALRGSLVDLWTAMPARLESFDRAAQTCSAQPTVQAKWRDPKGDGTYKDVTLPLCVDVPVFFPRGGDFVATFPLAPGDEGLLVFASRCVDAWWQSGGVQPQAEFRLHDLSDGFFFPGFTSQPRKLDPPPSEDMAQLRALDGQSYVGLGAAGLVRIQGADVHIHATDRLSVDVDGNGFVWKSRERHDFVIGLDISDTHDLNPPEVPEDPA